MSKDDDKKKNDPKDYEVGYGKPPKKNQFGAEEGNPQNKKGRPPGRNVLEFDRLSEEAFWYSFHESGQKAIPLREDGQEIMIPLIMALAKSMAREALNGDKHARKEYLRYLEKAVKGKDKLVAEMHSILTDYRERKLEAMQNPGSLECYEIHYRWFIWKKHMRIMDGEERMSLADSRRHIAYEDDEPITEADWAMFMQQYEYLKKNPSDVLAWPPPYPSRLEDERFENLTEEERTHEFFALFKNRKEMREKEGIEKWPYMVEEPVSDRDWECFEQHIQDRLNAKENPAPWPPAYWDDQPDQQGPEGDDSE